MNSEDSRFFEGFALPLHSSFTECLGRCRFERGDVIYNTPKGYLQWDEALKHIKFIIQVKEPASGVGMASDEAGVFEENWRSPVVFHVTYTTTGQVKEIRTTQGRLYTFLWKGDWSIFESPAPLPCPLTCFTLLKSSASVAYEVKARLAGTMEKPNVFIMTYDPTHKVSCAKYEEVKKRLTSEFTVVEHLFNPSELGMGHISILPTVRYACFAIDLGASSKISDVLKEVLYRPALNKKTDNDRFCLSAHGHFLPSHTPTHGDLVTISFKHGDGLFYRYRLQKPRLEKILPELKNYLNSQLVDCPNHFFLNPPHCSKLRLELPIKLTRDRTHKLTDYAGESLAHRHYKSTHENVQRYLLEHDVETIAVEVPVWAEWDELGECSKYITPTGTLTGHIDLLRYSSGTVEVWDFKPGAFNEITAAGQVLLYAHMLSQRTGIPLSKMQCGYFDASDAFVFDPQQAFETAFNSSQGVLSLEQGSH